MKNMLRSIILIGILSLSSLFVSAADTIVLTSLDWEPYIGQKLEGNGYVAEIARQAFKKSGYKLEIQFHTWARAKKLAVDGKVDGYFPEYFAEDLKTHSHLSRPFKGGPIGLFKRKGADIKFTSLEDLKPYKIGVVRGYVNEEKFDAAKFLKKEESKDDLQNIKKLIKKRIDVFVADKFVGLYAIKTNMPDQLTNIEFIDPPMVVHQLYICISKKTKDAAKKIEALNKGLEAMEKDGSIVKILKKHNFN